MYKNVKTDDEKYLTNELIKDKQTPIVNDDFLLLNGTWKAKKILNDKTDGDFSFVEQPGPILLDDPYESPDNIPNFNRVTQEHHHINDGAIVEREFTVPEKWRTKRIIIRFDGIYPAGIIYLNDEVIKEQFSGLTPIEIDITDKVHFDKENILKLRLYRRHEFVAMDMPRHASGFCGISRNITLFATEKSYIADYALKVDVENGLGTVDGKILISSQDDNSGLEIILTDNEDNKIDNFSSTAASGDTAINFRLTAKNPLLWDDEVPNLYKLIFSLKSGDCCQIFEQKIGFRHFICKDGRATINGNPVKFRGVNLLSIHHTTGMYVSEEFMRDSITMMKRANVNCIRTHFFSPEYLPRLCDEMGIYLIQELPIDWGHPYLGKNSAMNPMLLRLDVAVRRDRNFTSIMLWSIGNENMALDESEYDTLNKHLWLAKAQVTALDMQKRLHIFPPPGPANVIKGILEAKYGEVADTHYSFNLVKEFYKNKTIKNPRTWGMDVNYNPTDGPTFEEVSYETLKEDGWSEVWFSSEWGITNLLSDPLFAPYNVIITDNPEEPFSGKSTQNAINDRFTNEWGYMREDEHCLGGAFFAWIAPNVGDTWGWTKWAEDADWGIVLPDLTPKSVFWAVKNQFSPLQFSKEISYDVNAGEITFELYNGCTRFDLKDLTFYVQLSNFSTWVERNFFEIKCVGAPGTISKVSVPLKDKKDTLDALSKGHKIIMRIAALRPDKSRIIQADIIVSPKAENLTIKENNDELFIGPDVKL